MNRILQNREVQRQQTTAEFVRELNAAVDRDLQGTCDPISELDEKGHPKGAEGTICTFREGKWWRVVPWRRKASGDPPGIDYSMTDDWVCPVYGSSATSGSFFVDAVATPLDDECSAEAVRKKAIHIASALTCSTEKE
jgi:hypothetical protein